MTEPPKKKRQEHPNSDPNPGCLWSLVLAFIAIFIIPIMWIGEKIKGGGVGFGPALASFMMATIIVMVGVAAAIGVVAYLAVRYGN